MNDHTPWTVRAVSGCAGGAERLAVVNLRVTCNADTVEEVRALAAAAPDLLAALEELVPCCAPAVCASRVYRAIEGARAAIAKARGEG